MSLKLPLDRISAYARKQILPLDLNNNHNLHAITSRLCFDLGFCQYYFWH